ncbi:MAG TPA: protein kinase [bacterium]|nr:protein kinase [bacterium]HPR88282.1 protein kinase [bacterium]
MNIEANSMIRDYRILRKLGEGGMGTVYLAEDTMLERQVAIKILNPNLTEDPQFVERFRSEAKVQSRLVHPHIASLHTFFIEEGCYCIVMEYAEGKTLKTMIENLLGRMPEERALRIFDQILQAVGYAHSKGIVHRDLKPSNIIVDADDRVKVMDFGIAKIIGEKGMTRTGAKIGTLYYMSPEQVRAQKDIDQRSDIYSLAIILYEMLTKQLPFNADTESDFEVMQEIVEREIPPLKQLAPEVSHATEVALVAAAAKDREARLQSCQAFMNALAGRLPIPNQQHASPAAVRQPVFQSDVSHRLRPGTSAGAPFIPDAELTGVNGWLLFFCIILTVLVPLQVLIGIINFKASFELWDHLTPEDSENVYLPVRLQMIVMAGLAVWGLFTGTGLWRQVAGAVQRVRMFLKMNMILSILASLIPLFFLRINSGRWDQVVGILSFGVVTNFIYFMIWNSYFAKSKRVANTFRDADMKPSASSFVYRAMDAPGVASGINVADQLRNRLESGMNLEGSPGDLFPGLFRSRIFADRYVVWYGAAYLGVSVFMLALSLKGHGFYRVFNVLFALPQLGLVIFLHNRFADQVKQMRLIALCGVVASLAGMIGCIGLLFDAYGFYRESGFWFSSFSLLSAAWLSWLGLALIKGNLTRGYFSATTFGLGLVLFVSRISILGQLMEAGVSIMGLILPGMQAIWAITLLLFIHGNRRLE